MKQTAYLSLGSNFPDAAEMLRKAREAIEKVENVQIADASPCYLTEPQNYREQPWFVNQVLRINLGETWSPPPFLKRMLALEIALGRDRSEENQPRFGPRPIDIDLLLFENQISDDPECILPHPRLTERAFVLAPLLDIAPDIEISGKSAKEWLSGLVWRREGQKIFQ